MPYRRKDSPVWWVSYTDASGKRVRCPTGTTNRKEAEALEAKWKLEAHQERHWDKPPSRAFDEVLLVFLQATQEVKRSARDDRLHARRLREVFGGREMNGLQPADIRAYIARRKADGVSNATVNRELS
ncbi:MAG: recombinase XerD, partial [Chloroflexi bacterium]|nr:recombinase XerD [Chloroflexota bacterium]